MRKGFETGFEQIVSETPERLNSAEMRKKLKDPLFLPSFEELSEQLERIPWSGPEWEAWYKLCKDEKRPIYEFWTKEYIDALGSYLAERIEELRGTEENPVIILEAGAGNGRLSHFLEEQIEKRSKGKGRIIATDSGAWDDIEQSFPVERLAAKEAAEKYKPRIVITSWMPFHLDYTSDIRKQRSVEEYLLIGEADGECCGDPWETWGRPDAFDDEEWERQRNQIPAYKRDGFEQEDLEQLSMLQLSRMNVLESKSTTSTVSFRKKSGFMERNLLSSKSR